jgi:hypothetical protein
MTNIHRINVTKRVAIIHDRVFQRVLFFISLSGCGAFGGSLFYVARQE